MLFWQDKCLKIMLIWQYVLYNTDALNTCFLSPYLFHKRLTSMDPVCAPLPHSTRGIIHRCLCPSLCEHSLITKLGSSRLNSSAKRTDTPSMVYSSTNLLLLGRILYCFNLFFPRQTNKTFEQLCTRKKQLNYWFLISYPDLLALRRVRRYGREINWFLKSDSHTIFSST